VLKVLRAVLRWGRRRHPNGLTIELSGLFELPSQKRKRLAYAADAYGLERVIEAVERRKARDLLLPIRDAALIAAMGFTIAARPSEWLRSATWIGVHERSVELQLLGEESDPGLKTGARAALLLPNATARIRRYRSELERRFGPQPDHGLVFQTLRRSGPVWSPDGKPVPWSFDEYKRWTARVWRPARLAAAKSPDVPVGLGRMRFHDCRHTAISIALHSTLVISEHGMNLHNLAAWAGHDVSTLQRYYSHVIARYDGGEPIDLHEECAAARQHVLESPFIPPEEDEA
jgi:integrase